jgi:hypothetical protein
MKAYLATILLIDHEGHGIEEAENSLIGIKGYSSSIMNIKEVDIGEWTDEHPLNKFSTMESEVNRLFNTGEKS